MTFTWSRRDVLRSLAAAPAAALCGCPSPYVPIVRGWENARRTDYVLPRWRWAPKSARDVVDAVARASKEGHRIRMVGSGHSFSDVAVTDDWLLDPTGLTALLPLDASSLRTDARPETLVRVGGGMTIRALNQALDGIGLALENMGGADFQTYVGAASTATHGSGLSFGPLASQIVAIQVVKSTGELLQVEPTRGVTDTAKFAGRLQEDGEQRIRLVQDDDIFNALAVGLGCLGIIYAVVMRAVRKFWLIERRTLTTWEALAAPGGALTKIVAGEPLCGGGANACGGQDRDPDHVEIYYTPYPASDGSHMALLTERWRTTTRPPDLGGHRGSPFFTAGSDLTALADHLGLLEPVFVHPSTAAIRAFHETSLRDMAQDRYVNVSYRVFSVGILNFVNAYGIELAFPLDHAKAAVVRQFAIADDLAKMGLHHSSPLSLRFVAPSTAHIAMQHGRKTMMMEMGVLCGLPGAEELLRTYEDVFVHEFMARPHWGLDRNVLRSEVDARRLYPAWDKWMAVYDDMNANGTFDGRFTDRLGISRHNPLPHA